MFPFRLTDDLSSQAIGSFSTDPSDQDVILVGTGEPGVRGGTGLYLTDNGGDSWFSIAMSPQPEAFFRIRHDPYEEHIVYAATTEGFFRLTDRGVRWTRTLTGMVSDIAINPWNTSVVHAVVWGGGYFRSTNYGITWTEHTIGLPTAHRGRGAIALAPSLPSRIYLAYSNVDDRHSVLGVYQSSDAGTSWVNVTPSSNYMGRQGWYNNVLTVDPDDRDTVYAGGVRLMKTTDAGSTWAEVWDADLHADYHAFAWSSDGTRLYAGHDGGYSMTSDGGATWTSDSNILPITQYYHIDTHPAGGGVFGGATQDNGAPVTNDGGAHWVNATVSDAGGFVINPNNPSTLWCTLGVYGGDWAFERLRSTDSGINWTRINSGIPASPQWFPQLRHDQDDPGVLFTESNGAVYSSNDGGSTWSLYFGAQFSITVRDLAVTRWGWPNGRTVYVCLRTTTPGNRLWVATWSLSGGTTWSERSGGLPAGVEVRRVVPDPANSSRAYALMNGLGNAGNKVFLTTSRGTSWINITGDLPDVPVSDLVVHPDDNNILFLSSEFGCFRSTTGGTHWETWNNGMPNGAIVTDLATLDFRSTGDGFWVVAGTYGISIWRREISGADPAIFNDGFETSNTTRWSSTVG
jgi:photosystem II stability/assembly factor-like uncharacterized protein